MSQRLVTPTVNTNIPGAYPSVTVKSVPVGLGSSGIVVIVGEADGGASYTQDTLSQNSFTPDQVDKVTAKYLSGQIVDAFRALSAPSADADISGTASRIFILKTNTSAKAQSALAGSYGTFQDQNYGANGNKYKYQITSIAAESAPSKTGNTIPAFGAALNGQSFSVRLNGGAVSVVTLSGTAADHADVATLVVELNSLLPAGVVASAGTATGTIQIALATDNTQYARGSGRSFELIDSTPGDLAAVGMTAGLSVAAQEPAVEVATSRPDIGFSETLDIAPSIALTIGYAGTTATVTINQTAKTLVTTVTGGSGSALNIDLTQFRTIADLASYISAQTGYSATCPSSAQQLPTSALDAVSAIGAGSTAAQPARIKQAAYAFQKVMATSRGLTFVPTAQAGLPAPMTNPAFLTGGARGGTLAADVLAAIDQLAGIQVNIIVPLFSQDASADITAGATASSSTYTIAAVHAGIKNHCIQYSTTTLKRNRIAILSIKDTYAHAKAAAQGLAQYRCSITSQSASQQDSSGNIQVFQPWYAATVAAGMQAGGFYKSITNKQPNVISFQDPSGFDSGSPGDIEDALDAGMLIMSQDTTGIHWVSDQTTYGFDQNFVYNSLQAVYCADILALDLAASFQTAFVGKSLADVNAATALSFLAQKMDGYKKLKLIAGSDDAPLGYKNAKVSISAPTMEVSVEIKLATAIYFIPLNISLSQVQQNA